MCCGKFRCGVEGCHGYTERYGRGDRKYAAGGQAGLGRSIQTRSPNCGCIRRRRNDGGVLHANDTEGVEADGSVIQACTKIAYIGPSESTGPGFPYSLTLNDDYRLTTVNLRQRCEYTYIGREEVK